MLVTGRKRVGFGEKKIENSWWWMAASAQKPREGIRKVSNWTLTDEYLC